MTERIKKLTVIGMFAALAYVLHFIHIPVGFLNLDFKDVVMTVAGMYFGPIAGLTLSILVPLLEFPTGSTGPYGLIMNIVSSSAFVGTASLIYRFKKTLSGAIISLCSAVFAMTAVMMLANLWITPYFMGGLGEEVAAMIPTTLLPFNAVKAILNAALTLCLYKPMTMLLRKSGFGKQGSTQSEVELIDPKLRRQRTVLLAVISGMIAAIALCIIFFVMGGTIAFF